VVKREIALKIRKTHRYLGLFIALIFSSLSVAIFAQDVFIKTTINSLAFGSCNRTDLDPGIWNEIANKNPEAWIWLGDIVYTDDKSMKDLAEKYLIQKNLPAYQKLIKNSKIFGVWDDHDFGDNDAGSSFLKKEESRKLLFDFLNLPKNHPAQKREGAFQSYCFGVGSQKICLYLLDVRYFKEDYESDPSPSQRYKKNKGLLLGKSQWDWLENELKSNDAVVNLFAGGIQLISSEHAYEKWANFPLAQKRFFDLLAQYKIKTPLYLSGDRHIAEVSAISLESGYCLYDVTSSGLTHSYNSLKDEVNSFRISPLMTMLNFGIFTLDWENRLLKLEILDKKGIAQFTQNIMID
jgi:alkaline phosphatase D